MSLNVVPPPVSDPIALPKRQKYVTNKQRDPQEGLISQTWADFFTSQGESIASAVKAVNSVAPANQSASIGATDLSGGGLAGGLYSLSWYAAIIVPASVSSSLQVTIDWTDRAVAKSISGAAITGNTNATVQTGVLMIRIDAGSPVRYSAVYGSVGTAMTYDLVVVLSAVGA